MESNSCRIAARCCLTDGLAIPAPSLLNAGGHSRWPDNVQSEVALLAPIEFWLTARAVEIRVKNRLKA